jgi:hypothetical protein
MANKKVKFELTAVDKTKAAFDKVTKGLKGVGGVAAGAAKGVAGVGLAATGAAVGLALFTKKSFDYIDTLGKTASRTGIATDTLQAFQLAAIESGTTVEQTQKGLEKFARSIGDAGRGLKTQADIFRDLGVEIKESDGTLRSFEDILFDVADGLGELGSEAERATALANLFGRAGIQFSEIFREGAEGLDEFINRANRLGIILDRNTIKNVEKFNDTVSVIKLQINAVANNITAAFVPALQKIAEDIGVLITPTENAGNAFEAMGKTIAVSVLTAIRSAIIAIDKFVDTVQQKFNEFAQSKIGKKIFGDIFTEEEKARAKFEELKKYYAGLIELFKREDLGDAILPENFPQRAKELYDEMVRVRSILIEMNSEINGTDIAQSPALLYIEELIQKVKDGGSVFDEFFESLNSGLTDNLNPLEVFIAQLEDVEKTIQQTAVSTMKKFEDSIIDGLKNGKFAFKDFADYVIEQILRIAIQQAIIKPITGKIEGFLGGIFSEKKALGGFVKAGNPYMVGESGRELFVPSQNGQIVSNQDLKQTGQTTAPTVNFNISTVDAAGFDQLLASRKGLITQIINNAMNNQGKMGIV